MATIQISDAGSSLKITVNGTDIRNIQKQSIKEISVIKTNIIKIDIGAGALNNIFLPFADVVFPVQANAEDLKDFIIANYLKDSNAIEIDQFNKLTEISTIVDKIKVETELLDEPLVYDDTNPYVIYKGFAVPSSSVASPAWAIQRITQTPLQTITEWADGNKDFDNIWNDRFILVYV
jgi:hypothetical protein